MFIEQLNFQTSKGISKLLFTEPPSLNEVGRSVINSDLLFAGMLVSSVHLADRPAC